MPERTYGGPYAETEVFLPDGTSRIVAKGASETFPDDVAAALDATGDWSASKAKTPKAADGGKE
jgi:hypothetical protein